MVKYLIILILLNIASSCKTSSGSRSHTAFYPQNLHTYYLSTEESTDIYDALSRTSIANSSERNRLGTLNGVLHCDKKDGDYFCFVRTRIINSFPYLSERQKTNGDYADGLVEKMIKIHKQLVDGERLVANVDCYMVGKDAPPYGVESKKCDLSYPRFVDETILLDKPANDLAQAFLPPEKKVDTDAEWLGSLSCDSPTVAASSCKLKGGDLKAETLLAPQISEAVMTAVQRTFQEHWAIDDKVRDRPYTLEPHTDLGVICEQKIIETKTSRSPLHLCRVRP